MTIEERRVASPPAHVKTATLHWLYDPDDGLYHPRGNPRVFGRPIRPCHLATLVERHGRVEVVEE